ncbi:MAG: NifU N-terminal domain-containing protein [Actinomycetota bacterium]|nr:NifU N-terminal domain-containing protein [Actinomycetota bacterium]
MGQLITVNEKRGIRPDVVIFELNRSLTGMGHERYRSAAAASGLRPVDALARRLFEAGGVEGIHVYSNVVTVDLAPGASGDGLADVIRDLFTYYREGVEVAEPG